MIESIAKWVSIAFQTAKSSLKSKSELMIEIAALRQQLAVFKSKQPKLQVSNADRSFWGVVEKGIQRLAKAFDHRQAGYRCPVAS